jgi:hypothetical protein
MDESIVASAADVGPAIRLEAFDHLADVGLDLRHAVAPDVE